MRNNYDPVFGFPRVIRFSWSTAATFIEENCVPFTWEEYLNDTEIDHGQPTISKMWGKPSVRDDVYNRLGVVPCSAF